MERDASAAVGVGLLTLAAFSKEGSLWVASDKGITSGSYPFLVEAGSVRVVPTSGMP